MKDSRLRLLWALLILSICATATSRSTKSCDSHCVCYQEPQSGLKAANCSNADYTKASFRKLFENVQVLRVSDDNQRASILSEHALSCPHLEQLYLNDNQLSSVDHRALKNCRKLKVLDLSYNKISKSNQISALLKLNLEKLILKGNPLGVVPELSSASLISLDLSHCGLHILATNSFAKLKNLHSLNLEGNRLTKFRSSLPKSLRILNLSRNDIMTISQIEQFSKLKMLELSGNPLHCTCALLELRNELTNEFVQMHQKTVCVGPRTLRGLSWAEARKRCSQDQRASHRQRRDIIDSDEEGSGYGESKDYDLDSAKTEEDKTDDADKDDVDEDEIVDDGNEIEDDLGDEDEENTDPLSVPTEDSIDVLDTENKEDGTEVVDSTLSGTVEEPKETETDNMDNSYFKTDSTDNTNTTDEDFILHEKESSDQDESDDETDNANGEKFVSTDLSSNNNQDEDTDSQETEIHETQDNTNEEQPEDVNDSFEDTDHDEEGSNVTNNPKETADEESNVEDEDSEVGEQENEENEGNGDEVDESEESKNIATILGNEKGDDNETEGDVTSENKELKKDEHNIDSENTNGDEDSNENKDDESGKDFVGHLDESSIDTSKNDGDINDKEESTSTDSTHEGLLPIVNEENKDYENEMTSRTPTEDENGDYYSGETDEDNYKEEDGTGFTSGEGNDGETPPIAAPEDANITKVNNEENIIKTNIGLVEAEKPKSDTSTEMPSYPEGSGDDSEDDESFLEPTKASTVSNATMGIVGHRGRGLLIPLKEHKNETADDEVPDAGYNEEDADDDEIPDGGHSEKDDATGDDVPDVVDSEKDDEELTADTTGSEYDKNNTAVDEFIPAQNGTKGILSQESSESPLTSTGSYVVLALIMVLIVFLLGYAVYKSRLGRRRSCNESGNKKDPELGKGTDRELLDVSKPLLMTTPAAAVNGKSECQQPLVSKPTENPELKDEADERNDKKNSSPLQPRYHIYETLNGDKERIPVAPPVTSTPVAGPKKSPSPTRVVSKIPPSDSPVPNMYGGDDDDVFLKDASPALNGFPEDGKPVNGVSSFQTSPVSPRSGRVTIVARDDPDSVPKKPVFVVNPGSPASSGVV